MHRALPHHRLTSRPAKTLLIRLLLSRVTHLAVDGFLPLYDRIDRGNVGEELPRLRKLVLNVALIAHGSDVRDPDLHMKRYRSSYFNEAEPSWVEALRRQSLVNRQAALDSNAPLFVSTPDLLADLPTAEWLPLAIDFEAWRCAEPPLTTRIPTIVHVPSRRKPPIKGTAIIDQVLRRVHESGRIRYVSPPHLPNASMRSLIQGADVVVDQIMSGSYGAAAVEGMAAGRLVVGFVGEDVRTLLPENPPIVDAEPAVFAEVVERIADEPEKFAEQASRGPAFAERWHDGRSSAQALASFVGTG